MRDGKYTRNKGGGEITQIKTIITQKWFKVVKRVTGVGHMLDDTRSDDLRICFCTKTKKLLV